MKRQDEYLLLLIIGALITVAILYSIDPENIIGIGIIVGIAIVAGISLVGSLVAGRRK